MSKLTWNAPGDRLYEIGLDRGVFYPPGAAGFAWNGLTAVTESKSAQINDYYYEGVKYLSYPLSEEFNGTIEALNAPRAFLPFDGMAMVGSGLIVDQQPRKIFGMSYRTLVGNDTQGNNYAYRIHLVYNIMVEPTERSHRSLSDESNPVEMSWAFRTIPIWLASMAPTAHLIVESLNEEFAAEIEDILYGTDVTAPRLPPPAEVISILGGL